MHDQGAIRVSRLQTDFLQGCPYLKRARELSHVHFYNVLVPIPRTAKPPPRGPRYQHSRVPLDFHIGQASSLTSPSEQWQKTKGRWNPKGRGCEPDTSSPRVLKQFWHIFFWEESLRFPLFCLTSFHSSGFANGLCVSVRSCEGSYGNSWRNSPGSYYLMFM